MKIYVLALAFLSLALVGTSGALQRGGGRVTGTVKDSDGNPIANAHLEVTQEGTTVTIQSTSNENGSWVATGFRGGTWTFTVTADGYALVAQDMAVKELARNPPLDLVLEKATASNFAASDEIVEKLTEANQLYDQGDFAGALAMYQQLIEENPPLYQLHTNVGNVYKEQGNLDQAVAEYRIVLEQEPSNAAALVSIGDVLAKQEKFDEALPYFEQAIDVSPFDETVPYNVAELLFNGGNVARAIEFYQRATTIKPDWANAYLKTGYAYLNLGQMDEAAAQFQRVLEVAPDGPQAAQAQAVLGSLGK